MHFNANVKLVGKSKMSFRNVYFNIMATFYLHFVKIAGSIICIKYAKTNCVKLYFKVFLNHDSRKVMISGMIYHANGSFARFGMVWKKDAANSIYYFCLMELAYFCIYMLRRFMTINAGKIVRVEKVFF